MEKVQFHIVELMFSFIRRKVEQICIYITALKQYKKCYQWRTVSQLTLKILIDAFEYTGGKYSLVTNEYTGTGFLE